MESVFLFPMAGQFMNHIQKDLPRRRANSKTIFDFCFQSHDFFPSRPLYLRSYKMSDSGFPPLAFRIAERWTFLSVCVKKSHAHTG